MAGAVKRERLKTVLPRCPSASSCPHCVGHDQASDTHFPRFLMSF
jgi:hypothetical protein